MSVVLNQDAEERPETISLSKEKKDVSTYFLK